MGVPLFCLGSIGLYGMSRGRSFTCWRLAGVVGLEVDVVGWFLETGAPWVMWLLRLRCAYIKELSEDRLTTRPLVRAHAPPRKRHPSHPPTSPNQNPLTHRPQPPNPSTPINNQIRSANQRAESTSQKPHHPRNLLRRTFTFTAKLRRTDTIHPNPRTPQSRNSSSHNPQRGVRG